MQPDALGPTAPQHAHDPRALQPVQLSSPPPASHPRGPLAIAALVGLLVGIVLGVLIGQTTSTTTAVTAPPAIELGYLHVSSRPMDGNVVVDGRFVGVAPIDRVDLDPGTHSVVIDAFGYQPYSGTLESSARQAEPVGDPGAARRRSSYDRQRYGCGHREARGRATLGARARGAPPAKEPTPKPAHSHASSPAPAPAHAPSRPRRDCSGEKSRCQDSCRSASTDCRFSCPGCASCSTSVGWDECNRQCATCKSGCEQNTKFCETGCDSQYNSCEASQP